MTDKQEVIINNINLDDVKKLLYTGQRTAITTATFEKIIELLEEKTAECEELKKQLVRYKAYKEMEDFISQHSEDSNEHLGYQLFQMEGKLQIATEALKDIYDQADEIYSDGFRTSLFCKQVRSSSLQALEQIESEEQ